MSEDPEKPAQIDAKRNEKGQIEPGSTLNPRGNYRSLRQIKRQGSFKDAIRTRCGASGEKLWATLADIAEGIPWTPKIKLPNGMEMLGEPQIPSTSDRRMAAVALAEFLFGKAVPQTEAIKAEEEAQELATVRALSDDELAEHVRLVFEARKAALGPGQTETQTVEPE